MAFEHFCGVPACIPVTVGRFRGCFCFFLSAVFVGAFVFFFEGFQSNVKDVLESCWRSNVSEPLNSKPFSHSCERAPQARRSPCNGSPSAGKPSCQHYVYNHKLQHTHTWCRPTLPIEALLVPTAAASQTHMYYFAFASSQKTATKPTIAYTDVNCLTCQPSKNWPKQAPHNHQKPNEPVLVFTADTHVNPSDKGPQLPTRRFLSAASAPPQKSSLSSNLITRHTRSF